MDKKKVWKVTKDIVSVVLFLLLLTLSFQGFKVNANKDYIPSLFNHIYLNVLSGSMEPEFSPNDLIIGKKVKDTSTLNVGDIITFRDGQSLVTHRIVEVKDNGNSFVTKGDANETNDFDELSSENIVAKYTMHIPMIGYLVSKFYDFKFQALLYAILLFSIFSDLFKEVKKSRAEKKATEEETTLQTN